MPQNRFGPSAKDDSITNVLLPANVLQSTISLSDQLLRSLAKMKTKCIEYVDTKVANRSCASIEGAPSSARRVLGAHGQK